MRLALGVIFLSLMPALAADTEPPFQSLTGRIVRARCHMDVCTWFSIEQSVPEGTSKTGTLLHLTIKNWTSVHPGGSYERLTNRKYVNMDDDYVLCSKSRPAFIYKPPDKDQWLADRLSPDRDDQIFGANEGLYVRYWAACHAVAIDNVYTGGVKLAATLGYHTTPGESDAEQPLDSPEAALLW